MDIPKRLLPGIYWLSYLFTVYLKPRNPFGKDLRAALKPPFSIKSVYPWSQLLSDLKKQKFSFWTYLNCASFYKWVSTILFPPVSSIYYLEVIVMHQVYCLSASIMPTSSYLSLSLISYLIWCMQHTVWFKILTFWSLWSSIHPQDTWLVANRYFKVWNWNSMGNSPWFKMWNHFDLKKNYHACFNKFLDLNFFKNIYLENLIIL